MELQRQMGFGSYGTAWAWLHKIRRAMVVPGREPLRHRVEADETLVGRPQPGRPGRGAAGKTVIAGAVESRRGHRARPPARPPAPAGGTRRLGQQPGRLSRPERPAPRHGRHPRLVGLSRPRGRGLRPRADPARPVLGRRRAPPAGDPPRLRAGQTLAPWHPPRCRQRQAPAKLSRRVRFPLQPTHRPEHRPPLCPPIEQAVLTQPTTYRAITHGSA